MKRLVIAAAALGVWLAGAASAGELDWMSPPAAPQAPKFPTGRLTGLLLGVGAAAVIARRRRTVRPARKATDAMVLIGKVVLGPKSGLGLVAVGDRRFLVGFGEEGVRSVARWETEEKSAHAPTRFDPRALFHVG